MSRLPRYIRRIFSPHARGGNDNGRKVDEAPIAEALYISPDCTPRYRPNQLVFATGGASLALSLTSSKHGDGYNCGTIKNFNPVDLAQDYWWCSLNSYQSPSFERRLDERVATAQLLFAQVIPFRPLGGVVVMSLLIDREDWLDAVTFVKAAQRLHRVVHWVGLMPGQATVPFSLLRRLQILLGGCRAHFLREASLKAADGGEEWTLCCDRLARETKRVLHT